MSTTLENTRILSFTAPKEGEPLLVIGKKGTLGDLADITAAVKGDSAVEIWESFLALEEDFRIVMAQRASRGDESDSEALVGDETNNE